MMSQERNRIKWAITENYREMKGVMCCCCASSVDEAVLGLGAEKAT
jgi:hypothetical protein